MVISSNPSIRKADSPAQIVEVSFLPEWGRHVAILIIPSQLARKVDQAFFQAQFFLYLPRMLLR